MPLGPMNGDPQLRNSITVQSNGAKGELYASMAVFGGTKTPSVQLLGRDSMQPYNAGAHPWTTAAGAASTLVMFNYSSAPQTFYVAIASGGVLWQQKYQLAALETKTLDIGSLIATGAKDESGLVLPAAATAGVAQWFTPNFGQGAGRLLVSQPGIGLARNFGCQIMAVLGGTSSMLNNNVTIAAGTSGQMGPYQADCYLGRVGFCGGTYNMTAPWSTNWTSSNPSVASIPTPSGPTTATINGNTAGSAGITAAGINQEYNVEGQEWWCTAPPQQGTVTVYDPGPSNVSINPTSFIVGTAASFTITGNNLGTNCPTLSFPFPATYSLGSCTDQTVTGTLTASGAGSGDFTLSSGGFGGQGFLASPGQSQNTTSPPITAILPALKAMVLNPPVANDGDAIIATRPFTLQVQAYNPQTNQVITSLSGTVTVNWESGRGGESLPSQISLSGGVGTASVTLNTVNNTSQTRWYMLSTTYATWTSAINVWFQVFATDEGLVGQTTACGRVIQPQDHFVALPAGGLCGTSINLRSSPSSISQVAPVEDVGPWYPNSTATAGNPCVGPADPYWNTSGVPRAATASCSNGAGIDLADGTFSALGLTGNSTILWRFGQ